MNLSAPIYCSSCQQSVKPIKCIVIHRCPKCGAPFVGYPEPAQDDEAGASECNSPGQELTVA